MKSSINTLIIDDEPQSRLLIKKLLEDFAGTEFIVYEAGNAKEALGKANDILPQLVFLDIQMKGETGFDFLDKLRNWNFEIIFITAHGEFAIKAFRYCALDYLLKPIDKIEFDHYVYYCDSTNTSSSIHWCDLYNTFCTYNIHTVDVSMDGLSLSEKR